MTTSARDERGGARGRFAAMRRSLATSSSGLIAALLLATGAHAAETISVESAWARATPAAARTGAVYLTLRNAGGQPARLVGATTPAAARVEFHRSSEEDGIARMRPVEQIEIPSGGEARLAPGGTHLMLVGLERPLKAGGTLQLTLEFDGAERRTVEVPIEPIGAQGPSSGPGEHRGHGS